jgi:hypothetical protein
MERRIRKNTVSNRSREWTVIFMAFLLCGKRPDWRQFLHRFRTHGMIGKVSLREACDSFAGY